MKVWHLWQLKKSKSSKALTIWPIYQEIGQNGLNWQCCLAGSSKTAPRILIFSIAMGAKPSFYIKFIAKGGFFSESKIPFSNLPISKKKYSKKTILNLKFKFQAQDSFFGDLKNELHFLKKIHL